MTLAHLHLLLNHVPTQKVATYAYVNPVVAMFLGITLGGEVLSGAAFVALPLILISVALVATPNRVRRRGEHLELADEAA